MTQRILVGVIGAPHGVRGQVRLKSFTARPADIAAYGTLLADDGRRSLTITAARPLKDDMIVATFAGVTTREAAAALTGLRLTIPREALPEPEEEEFYQADLLGLVAEAEDGTPLGRVLAVQDHGAGDVLEIGGRTGQESILVAFTRGFVPVVDIAGGRLVVAAGALVLPGDDEGDDAGAEGDN